MTVSDNKIYITYYLTDETKKPSVTRYINKAYVAVYSYPELEYITTMEDERAAIAGSWNAYNGIFQTESGRSEEHTLNSSHRHTSRMPSSA